MLMIPLLEIAKENSKNYKQPKTTNSITKKNLEAPQILSIILIKYIHEMLLNNKNEYLDINMGEL